MEVNVKVAYLSLRSIRIWLHIETVYRRERKTARSKMVKGSSTRFSKKSTEAVAPWQRDEWKGSRGRITWSSTDHKALNFTLGDRVNGLHAETDEAHACSGVSDCLQPHELWPTRLLCLWDFSGKDTGVGTLEWVATSSSGDSSQPRDRTWVSYIFCTGRRNLYHWATWEA